MLKTLTIICRTGFAVVLIIVLVGWPMPARASSLQVGIEAIQDQRYKTAIVHFNRAIQHHEQLSIAYEERCLAYLLINEPLAASDDCTTALTLLPDQIRPLFYRALAQYRLADYNAAIADFTQYLKPHSQDAQAYYNRGLALFAQGDLEAAIADYHQAVAYSSRLSPVEMSNLYNDLGIAYLASTQPERALIALDQAIALDNTDPRAYFNHGCACHYQGDYAGALRDFELVLAIDPAHAETYFNRGLIQQQMGQHTEAIANLETAVKYFQQQQDLAGAHRAQVRLRQLTVPPQAMG